MSDINTRYNVPVYDCLSVDEYVPSLLRCIVRIPLANGMMFEFLQDLNGSDPEVLTCTFHGARDPRVVELPYFIRAASLKRVGQPHLLFSDPTMTLNPSDLRLCWYSGTRDVDVAELIDLIVKKAIEFIGGSGVQFEGSSGGGFMALRMSYLMELPTAALAVSPQVNAFDYEKGKFVDRTIEAAAFGEDVTSLKAELGSRFDLRPLLKSLPQSRPFPVVRYVQNQSDHEHVRLQLKPFLEASGLSYDESLRYYAHGRTKVLLQDHGNGHIAPPAGVWDEQSKLLRTELVRAIRSYGDRVSSSATPVSSLPCADGEYLIEGAHSSSAVRYRIKNVRETGKYVRVFFQSAAFRSANDEGVAYRLPQVVDTESIADISVSDPTLMLDRRLTAGWYLGGAIEPAFITIARHLTEFLNGSGASKLVLIGQTVGGYGAIQVAAHVDRAEAFVFNPTMSLTTIDKGPAGRLVSAAGLADDALEGSSQKIPKFDILATARDVPLHKCGQVSVIVAEDDRQYRDLQMPFIRAAVDAGTGWMNVCELVSSLPSLSAQEEFVAEFLESSPGRSNDDRFGIFQRTVPGAGGIKVRNPEEIRVGVYGGCVTRDTATKVLSRIGSGEVSPYIARQSLISAGSPVSSDYVTLSALESKWQKRRLAQDFVGSAFDELQNEASGIDVLLFDLLMERHGILELDRGYVTPSYELSLSGGLAVEHSRLGFGSTRHFELWSDSFLQFTEFLKRVELFDRTILFAVPWALTSTTGGDSGNSEGLVARVANRLYVPYYDLAFRLGYKVLSGATDLVNADANNRWGLAPYHYTDSVYDDLASTVLKELGVEL